MTVFICYTINKRYYNTIRIFNYYQELKYGQFIDEPTILLTYICEGCEIRLIARRMGLNREIFLSSYFIFINFRTIHTNGL